MERSIKYEGDNTGITTTMATDDGGTGIGSSTASPASSVAYQPQHSVSAMQQILSPLQLFHTQSGSGGQAGASLSWMAPYQMMMLPGSAVPQPLFLPPNGAGGVIAMHDGQVFVTPINDGSGNNLMPVDISGNCVLPIATADSAGEAAVQTPERVTTIGTVSNNPKADVPKPPKKPLTPYMIFSKQIWPQVKAEHTHLSSVTELGAIVGQLWRDLDATQKQQYNELYAQDKSRYDDELARYLKQTGLLASDVAKMRCKRPPHARPAPSAAAPKNVPAAAAAGGIQAWSNGGAVKQTASGATGMLPALYANQDGTITVGGVTAAGAEQKPGILTSVYSDAHGNTMTSTADVQRWAWHQPIASIDSSSGMVMYQMSQGDQAAASSDGQQQQQPQLVYNGIPTSGSSTDSKAWIQSANRVEQLEAEVQRLRSALSDKTVEAQNLRDELNAVMHSIEERRRLASDGLQTMSNATDVQPAAASVENNNTAKSDMPAAVVNGIPE